MQVRLHLHTHTQACCPLPHTATPLSVLSLRTRRGDPQARRAHRPKLQPRRRHAAGLARALQEPRGDDGESVSPAPASMHATAYDVVHRRPKALHASKHPQRATLRRRLAAQQPRHLAKRDGRGRRAAAPADARAGPVAAFRTDSVSEHALRVQRVWKRVVERADHNLSVVEEQRTARAERRRRRSAHRQGPPNGDHPQQPRLPQRSLNACVRTSGRGV